MIAHRRRNRPRYDRVASRSAAVVIAGYSTSFGWATRLLPADMRGHIRNIYALVRVADEIVDEPDAGWPAADRARLLDDLEAETRRAVQERRSPNLVVHAFALTARSYGIDADLIDPFFASMRTDLTRSGHDAASLTEYVYGSAEVVGLMCLRVFVDGDAAAYDGLSGGARRLGAAFQKVNFLRDLGADLDELGRSYVQVDPDSFHDTDRDRLLDDIDDDLAAAQAALLALPVGARVAVRAAHSLFAELSRRLRATPATDIRRTRVRVPGPRKAWLVGRALVSRGRR
ncbi:squalene/phytoene synthase family protein [Pseudactinotalea sp. HY158]|uniref:phytoene/squalene synthase family protein n=1 Tax=Pseudactinotalea sp. HY158 TaxID=2654547 RepID=UPI00129D1712|nr:squalene/phytoene synthase family protein [Pseudactinotalea sp. HY158]QGH70204.1 phytoene/squalene synthase family protein [Pseudactinotalea sp. HY158]